jgi:hypothetical protein
MTHIRQSFSSPWGARVRILTSVVAVIFLSLSMLIGFNPEVSQSDEWGMRFLPVLIFLVMNLVMAPFLVLGYEVSAGEISIRRLGWVKRIPLTGISSVTCDPLGLRGATKIIGNDGYLAMIGWFKSKKMGFFRAFVTDGSRVVILKWPDKTILISPDDPETFIQSLEALIGRTLRYCTA